MEAVFLIFYLYIITQSDHMLTLRVWQDQQLHTFYAVLPPCGTVVNCRAVHLLSTWVCKRLDIYYIYCWVVDLQDLKWFQQFSNLEKSIIFYFYLVSCQWHHISLCMLQCSGLQKEVRINLLSSFLTSPLTTIFWVWSFLTIYFKCLNLKLYQKQSE